MSSAASSLGVLLVVDEPLLAADVVEEELEDELARFAAADLRELSAAISSTSSSIDTDGALRFEVVVVVDDEESGF